MKRARSLAERLTWMNLLVSGSALLLACASFAAFDLLSFRQEMVQNLSTQAQIIGTNSVSALLFADPSTAETTLSALSAAPNILSAGIYTTDGQLFAGYRRDRLDKALPGPPIPSGQHQVHRFQNLRIELVRRITFQGKQVGAIYLQSDLRELFSRLTRYGVLASAILLVSLVVALIVSRRTQRTVSEPLVRLAETARRVSQDEDYSVRAASAHQDYELGILIEAFNGMLTQIEKHDHSLQDARDRLEERVKERTIELDAANKELEAFSYSVSHDLRAPLRHVVGFAELLERRAGKDLDEQSQHYLRTVTTSAKRMGVLIDDLLDFSRTARADLVKSRISLDALVREAMTEVNPEMAGRRIEWILHPLPEIEADPALLRLALVNLLSNAVKYTGTRPEARIEVGTQPSEDTELVVFVRDNGVGFDMQYAAKLFGVFQRLHRADEFSGTGIGLANVHRIIQRHGGRTWAEAELDRGATFYFSLPSARRNATNS